MRKGIGLAQAFRMMTIVPFPGPDPEKDSTQLYFYPIVGAFIGALGALLAYLGLRLCKSSAVTSICLGVMWTCYMAFITRGFHLDGLGDTMDGFGGGWTKERRLEIMKDSRSGSFAVIAICLCLLAKGALASKAFDEGNFLLLAWSCVLARMQVVLMCSCCRYAKESGLSYNLVSGAGVSHSLVAVLETSAAAAGLYLLGLSVPCIAVSTVVSTLSMIILAIISYRKIGGLTGDILGACCEISEVFSLVCVLFVN